jgi:peptidoglycan/xylan/chitin deacetylase (PgdA/CDA1 family)
VVGHDDVVSENQPPVPADTVAAGALPRSGLTGPATGLTRRGVLRGCAAGLLLGLAGCSTAGAPTSDSSQLGGASDSAAAPPPGEAAPPSGEATPGASAQSPGAQGSAGGDRPPGGPALELVHAASGRPELSLTFHGAGDPALGRKVLEALERAGVAGTVLAVGTWLQANPDAARMVTDLGHELGNHTWSHRVMSELSVAAQRAEIERCRDRIAALTGGPGAFFRQSAARLPTPELLKLAGAAGYARVLAYDVDSLDYTDPSPDTVRRQVAAAKAGSVVSMHLGHPVTLAALPGILADLRRRDLRAVTATRLFAA